MAGPALLTVAAEDIALLLIQLHAEPQTLAAQAMSIQYHPEASPGPHDSDICFDQFIAMLVRIFAAKAARPLVRPSTAFGSAAGIPSCTMAQLLVVVGLDRAVSAGAWLKGSKAC
jgi:hypothetical protein